ncbi:NAD(P) transhydrogenase subunit alpha [Alphaproteobacteria bacterium]|nr:NAD(P) transhydrogenase subunit alpha [Alphaproteobacteria bacterium]
MIIATLKEISEDENRVAISPDTCKQYCKKGFSVYIEKNAGVKSSFLDIDFENNGAKVLERDEILNQADIILNVTSILKEPELNKLKKDVIFLGTYNPYENFKNLNALAFKNFSTITLDLLPRISRAQSMDVLSSQANLAGYKAVIEASSIFKKAMPMMMTAAGTIIPAKCLVLGAGVAGLQAVATAKRLGCVVSVFDVRPEVEEQVNSLGAKFIHVDQKKELEGSKLVYAEEMSDEYKKKQSEKIHEVSKEMDIIISTALIPGKKAPLLIKSNTIKSMKSGSVLIDLAASAGGNIEGSVFGKKVSIENTILYAPSNLPSLISYDASLLYSKNLFNFITTFINEEKKFNLDEEDEILMKTLIIKNGKKTTFFLKD